VRWLCVLLLLALSITMMACGDGENPAPEMDAEEVVLALRAAGAPIGTYVVYTDATDPNDLIGRPGGYRSKASFHDTRLPFDPAFHPDEGGTVEVFPDAESAAARLEYLEGIQHVAPLFAEHRYLRGAVLVRVSRYLTEEQAGVYEAAVEAVIGDG
jgi:hypothetical protein